MDKDRIEEILKKIGSQDIPNDIKQIAENQSKEFIESVKRQKPHISWSEIIMRNSIVKLAAAAVIIIAVIAGISLFEKTSSVVWADVVKQLENHTKYKCREKISRGSQELRTVNMYHLNLSQRREEYKDGTVSIFDLRGNDAICLTFNPESKKANITKYIGFGSKKDPDIIDMVKKFDQESTERLGTKEQNGKTLYGFRHKPNEYNDFTVWVDSNTKLPVEIELIHAQAGQTIYMDEFEFDFNLDPSAFSTEPPAGYEVETKIENPQN